MPLQVRAQRRRVLALVASVAGVVALGLLVARASGIVGLRIEVFDFALTSCGAILSTLVSLAAVVALRWPSLGWLCLAATFEVAAVGWLMLKDNPWGGSVVWMVSGRHGIHSLDVLAALPVAAGIWCVRNAWLGMQPR